ncbi:hypothetical protein J2W14_001174 [Pseudarthrobacter oxydans]|uniref:hypothetical protein n=1 Tax=Pseudarthrobacter oxydans TaxID=1671 RepID=UPI00277DDE08|nr:hypothetical protein [Pseudarthrobacter oxydans]MDP9981790.1 hypothetical protein [Pseudarthrobacter oxydans]
MKRKTGVIIAAVLVLAAAAFFFVRMTTEGTCQRRSNDIGPTNACSSSGSDGQYDYIMNVTDRDGTEPHLVVLSVRPHE